MRSAISVIIAVLCCGYVQVDLEKAYRLCMDKKIVLPRGMVGYPSGMESCHEITKEYANSKLREALTSSRAAPYRGIIQDVLKKEEQRTREGK